MGISLLMKKLVFSIEKDIAVIEIKPYIFASIELCYIKNRKLSKNSKIFLNYFENEMKL